MLVEYLDIIEHLSSCNGDVHDVVVECVDPGSKLIDVGGCGSHHLAVC